MHVFAQERKAPLFTFAQKGPYKKAYKLPNGNK
jgi:hypothetical protein